MVPALVEVVVAATNKRTIRKNLLLASCALLGGEAQAQEALQDIYANDWVFDASMLNYTEANDRVQVSKFISSIKGNVSDGDQINLKMIYDTMSGATPTGAVQNSSVVTVSGVSGGGITSSGTPEALTQFDDDRLAVNLDWNHEIGPQLNLVLGGGISLERDYLSVTTSAKMEYTDDAKINTYSLGYARSSDTISQTGGETPGPLTDVEDGIFYGEGERISNDFLIGLARVINARTLAQFSFSYTYSGGYHSDPYKVVSIANANEVEFQRIYESRPDERTRKALYTKLVHKRVANDDIVHLAYRYYSDDWDVRAQTLDLRYIMELEGGHSFEPHFRYYTQSAASFFRRTLPISAALNNEIPQFVSADYRLDALNDYTIGAKYHLPLDHQTEISLRLELLKQKAKNAVINENEATVVQLLFKREFK